MTAITEAADNAVRDFVTVGVPASGDHEPVKSELRAVFALIDAALSSLGVNGAITVKKATRALLDADLAHVADVLAVVYNDATAANNGIYAKSGGSGSGSWAITAIALPATFATDLAAIADQLTVFETAVGDGDFILTDEDGSGTTVVGVDTGAALTTGYANTLIGYRAGKSITTGFGNTISGDSAGKAQTTAQQSTATGYRALEANVTATGNTAVGALALKLATGEQNTGLGYSALTTLTTGVDNVGAGAGALNDVATGSRNVGVGKSAGYGANAASADNVFLGSLAGAEVTTPRAVQKAVAVGSLAGFASVGNSNIFLGYAAGAYLADSDRLIIDNRDRLTSADVLTKALVVGEFADARADQSLKVNGILWSMDGKLEMLDGEGNGEQGNISIGVGLDSVITGHANTRIGYKAGANITTAIGCTLIGENAGKDITTAINCTAIGWDSQFVNVSGQNNTSVGEDSLKYVTGEGNTGVGYTAGYSIDTGVENSAYGPLSLYYVTTGDHNAAYGWGAGGFSGDSSRNVVMGYSALKALVVQNDNVAIGAEAGRTATGSRNIFIGRGAGYGETASDRLVIANRTDSVSGTALLYGIMSGTTADQSLEVNGHLKIGSTAANGLSIINGAVTTALFERDGDATFRTGAGDGVMQWDWINASSGQVQLYLDSTTRALFGTTNNVRMGLTTNGTERLTVANSTGRIGINESAPDYMLDVNGSFGFTPGASVTPVDNGDVVFELTSNTSLTVKAKGSDGTVRSVVLTLA
jgi:hypothetical protein